MADITEAGFKAPDFSLPAIGGQTIRLSQFQGQKVVLYFYSKDNTSGCTDEARGFRDNYAEFTARDAVVLGVSRDSIEAHEKFSAKLELPFLLLSDTEATVSTLYNVLKLKNMYGKKVLGIERSTFIIDEQGYIVHVFRKVKAAGHAAEVLRVLDNLAEN